MIGGGGGGAWLAGGGERSLSVNLNLIPVGSIILLESYIIPWARKPCGRELTPGRGTDPAESSLPGRSPSSRELIPGRGPIKRRARFRVGNPSSGELTPQVRNSSKGELTPGYIAIAENLYNIYCTRKAKSVVFYAHVSVATSATSLGW